MMFSGVGEKTFHPSNAMEEKGKPQRTRPPEHSEILGRDLVPKKRSFWRAAKKGEGFRKPQKRNCLSLLLSKCEAENRIPTESIIFFHARGASNPNPLGGRKRGEKFCSPLILEVPKGFRRH